MAWVREALEDVAERLNAVDIPAAVDPRSLTVPGAWVTAGPIAYDRLSNDVRGLDVDVYLFTRDTGTPDALDWLADMIDAAADVFPIGDVTPQNVSLPNQAGDPLPAFVFRLTLEVS